MLKTLKQHWPEYLMEAAELGIFMISAGVFTLLLYHPASPVGQAIPSELFRRVFSGVAMGLTLVGIVYSPWGKRSGAHMNPAFTLTFFRLRKIAPWDAAFYSLAQFAGGLGGILLMTAAAARFLSHPSVNYVATLPGPRGPGVAFAAEAGISFVLVLVVLIVMNRSSIARFTGLVAGICVAAFITFESPVSGMSMNPARSLGSAFLPRLWQSLWIYFTAPPLGMFLAAEVYLLCKCRVACAKFHHQNHFRCIFCEYQSMREPISPIRNDPSLNLNPPNTTLHPVGPAPKTVLNRLSGFPLVLTLLLGFSYQMNAQNHSLTLQSGEDQTSLLELFTSEGCSSCPPAEKWLSGLKAAPGLWKHFVPVAFHVDYWDYLGWRDPWASKTCSDRQRAYAQRWRGDSIYTPGFVLNGQEWQAWSHQKDGPAPSGSKAGVLSVSSADIEHWQVSFSPRGYAAADYELHAAMLASGLTSDVKAGENRGRRLTHDFVVTALTTGSLKRHGDKLEGDFEFKIPKDHEAKRLALAAWVTPLSKLEPLQAVGGWLP